MLIDETVFVPGITKHRVTVTLTREDLKHDYSDGSDCPIYHAMRRAKVPVLWVGGTHDNAWVGGTHDNAWQWADSAGWVSRQKLPRECRNMLRTILFTDTPLMRWLRRPLLEGKSFVVEWQ